MQNLVKYLQHLILTVCLISSILAAGQNVSVEESKCLHYKKKVFEKVITFGAFMHGAPEMEYVVDNCKQYAPFIVGGSPASPKEFPHTARLGRTSKLKPKIDWFCGGTLISRKFVLTAAHCFYSRYGEVNVVRLGELDFSTSTDDSQPEDFNVLRYIPHPNYDEDSIGVYNDIGLIELQKKVNLSVYIHPACLSAHKAEEYDKFLAVGWGSTKFSGNESKVLLKVGLERIEHARCQSIAEEDATDLFSAGIDVRTQICAGSNETKDTCNGDSGGPLLAYHDKFPCMYYVIGITSASLGGCGSPDVPGIYTHVYAYLDWIKSYIWHK